MKLAIIGATGLVGTEVIKILQQRKTQFSELIPVASTSSIGNAIIINDKEYKIVTPEECIKKKPQFAIFSAGSHFSEKWAPIFAENDIYVIDNSSAWRTHPDIPLVVPEINKHILSPKDKIIANPNCSTIQLVIALSDIHKKFIIHRLIVSTYQSVSGQGFKGIKKLYDERNINTDINSINSDKIGNSILNNNHPIDLNAIPHIDSFLDNGYTKEEMKIVNETKKIVNAPDIKITATAVRIPTIGGHGESVNIELEKSATLEQIKDILYNTQGVELMDDIENNIYPTPITSRDKDLVQVGRVRTDFSKENSFNLWIAGDTVRKGAALNAIQILEYIREWKKI